EWCKVVSCLDNKKIQYRHNRNQLESGLANILLVIAEIAGHKTDIIDLVEYIEERCREGDLNSEKKKNLESRIEETLNSVFPKSCVRIRGSKMELGRKKDGSTGIFGILRIIPEPYGCGTISLHLKSDCAFFDFPVQPSVGIDKAGPYNEVNQVYEGINSYIKYIFKEYSVMEIADETFATLKDDSYYPISKIYAILSSGSENISKIFLIEKFSDNRTCKSCIIEDFILYSIENKLSPNHPATRFVANLLGSVPLEDKSVRTYTLQPLLFYSNWQADYPKLRYLPLNETEEKSHCCHRITRIYGSILKEKSVDLAVKCIENYLMHPMPSDYMYSLLTKRDANISVFYYIVKKGKIAHLAKLQSILEKTKNPEECINYIYVAWFISACINPNPTINKIVLTYNLIRDEDLTNPEDPNLRIYQTQFNIIVQALKSNKSMLCSEDNEQSMKKYNKILEKFGGINSGAATLTNSLYQRILAMMRSCIAWIKSFF
ncbi:hypothetical protein NEAUS03_2378, partial [Nematocida ausubeli]